MRLEIISSSLDKIFVIFEDVGSDGGFATDQVEKTRIRAALVCAL